MMNTKKNQSPELSSEQKFLLKIARTKMPFGKYAGLHLIDLPEPYFVWFSHKGFPKGELGEMMKVVYEIKVNGLEYLIKPLKKNNYNTGK